MGFLRTLKNMASGKEMAYAKWGAKDRARWNAAEIPSLGPFKHMPQWVGPQEANQLYAQLNHEVPFSDYKWNGVYKLPQEVFHYTLDKRGLDYDLCDIEPKPKAYQPVAILEHLAQRIERQFPVRVEEIFCNRFVTSDHNIDWHQDQYGDHLFVLSFGAPRSVEYRTLQNGPAPGLTARHGDLYYMHPNYDAVHEHRVLCGQGDRISLAIFARRL
mmetsp:Transcript_223/g.596  ORF Transcript_223/g.596 Transcript_223/m.596 type:complete len:215 (-) Transcript_223:130-774(-)